MGQEVVYCFKCQKRIHGTEFAKGTAYQVENNFCCSSCAVGVLETLPPKAKEQLLAKMFKATHDRQSATSSAKTSANPPASSTGRIPHATPRPMNVRPPSSSGPLIAGIVGAIVAVVLVVVFLSSGSPPPPPPTVPAKAPQPVANVDPGLSPEEKRRAEAARDAMKKAREFANANPKDLDGQLRQWQAAQLEAERTGYQAEARRETEKAEGRIKDAAAQELADLEREARALATRKEFKAAMDLVDRSRGKRPVDALRRELDDAAARAFDELKGKATAARIRGAKSEVDAAKSEVARWGIPQYVTDLEAALGSAWNPIFDGKSIDCLVSAVAGFWLVDNGALTRDTSKHDQAAQSRGDFGDGEYRFRFTFERVSGAFFAIRQATGGQCRVTISKTMADSMSAGPHELVFTCRGTTVSATLNGTSLPVAVEGTVQPRGRIQFNFADGSFRLLAIEMRDLP